jgi:signal transduction histidine kinase
MLKTLRGRFVLSHILPLIVILPLVGLLMVYVLESQVMLENLAAELETQAVLVAGMVSAYGEVWQNKGQAQAFVTTMKGHVHARVMLMDPNGVLVSSSDPQGDRQEQPLASSDWADVVAGQNVVRKPRTWSWYKEGVDVLVPVYGPENKLVGVVRLSYLVDSLAERFARHRTLIAAVVIGGVALGVVTGVLLAANLERPLRQVTQAVSQLSDGHRSEPLAERGPNEIRLLVRAVNTLVERLQSLEQARRKLLANLVHELGRPLGAFHSAIQALLRGADEDVTVRRDLLAGMEQEVRRLRRLLDDLAMLHDRTLGPLELDLRATKLSEWLAQTLAPWREAAQAKGLRWQADVPLSLPTIEIDPDRLGQAVGNLLSNAIKYTPSGGRLSVGAGAEGDAVWIRVSDTGPGIKAEDQARIFEPLYRAQADRRFPQGMGLGLSIAHDLVIAHGGRLEVQSGPGEGSEFTIWVPCSSDAVGQPK